MATVDKQMMQELRYEVTEALKVIGDMHGVTLTLGRGKFAYSEGSFPLQITPKAADGSVVDPKALAFKQNAYSYGLAPEDLGRTFTTWNGKYKIIGANPKAHKYPIIGRSLLDGKNYKFPAHVVRNQLSHVTPKQAAEALAKKLEFDPNAPF